MALSGLLSDAVPGEEQNRGETAPHFLNIKRRHNL